MGSEIADVLHAYCRLVDERRWDDATGVFAPDALVDFGDGNLLRGTEAIVQALTVVRDGLTATMHTLTNITAEATGSSTARSRAYVVSHLVLDQAVLHLAGTYVDDLMAGPDGWRISARTFVPMWSQGATEIIEEAMRRAQGRN